MPYCKYVQERTLDPSYERHIKPCVSRGSRPINIISGSASNTTQTSLWSDCSIILRGASLFNAIKLCCPHSSTPHWADVRLSSEMCISRLHVQLCSRSLAGLGANDDRNRACINVLVKMTARHMYRSPLKFYY